MSAAVRWPAGVKTFDEPMYQGRGDRCLEAAYAVDATAERRTKACEAICFDRSEASQSFCFFMCFVADDILKRLSHDGFTIVPGVLTSAEVACLIARLSASGHDALAVRARRERVYAMRNLLQVEEVAQLADSPALRRWVKPVVGVGAVAVRGLLFDKSLDSNWKVAWHQDLSIAVRERKNVPGFGPWSCKAGRAHVQPPVEILKKMLTVRVHLDNCGPASGPLKVIAGSHKRGLLAPDQIRCCTNRIPIECHVPAGGILLMRPLLLHASSSAVARQSRRVIHLEYAAGPLPAGLEWQAA